MKSKAVERLNSFTLEQDNSDSEPEIIDAKDLSATTSNLCNENTGLRKRKFRGSKHSQSETGMLSRSTSMMEDGVNFDEDIFVDEDDAFEKADEDDEEEVETGSVSITVT